MESREMVCIVCPLGCKLTVAVANENPNEIQVEGNKCPRGEEYGIKELTNPTRVLTSTVKINKAHLSRLPVKTDGAIPKNLVMECMKELDLIELEAPVKAGEVIIGNVLNTGIDIVASRSM